MRKKIGILILMVLILSLAGCRSKTEAAFDADSKTSTEGTEETIEEATEKTDGESQGVTATRETAVTEKGEGKTTSESDRVSASGDRVAATGTTAASTGSAATTTSTGTTAASASSPAAVSTPEPAAVSYSPQNVVALATSKCQAGGMITTQQNLDNLLAAGSISQEEYNQYYPYDGMEGSYYSVFVETDLTKASTIDGQPLPSEDAIADYIAGMLMLETDPVFYISYDGIYTTGGTDFYEFRCHR